MDLQLALTAAPSGTRILVASGTYKPTGTSDRTISFQLRDGVEIDGGYAGDLKATNPNARDFALYASILSGDIGTIGDNSDNSYHVVASSGTSGTAVLDGFTITAGNANGGASPDYYGGGMYNDGGSPTLINCTFTGNRASWDGAGMFNWHSSSPALTNCTFTGNMAGDYGGGMLNNTSSSPLLIGCLFSGNVAGLDGGAIANSFSSSPTLTNCSLSGQLREQRWGNP